MVARIFLLVCIVGALSQASVALTFKGSVVQADRQTPAAEITIQVEHHENRSRPFPDDYVVRFKTGADGRFEMQAPGVTEEYMLFLADSCGHIYDGFTHLHEDRDFGVLVLQRGCVLSGLVRDPDGNIMPDVEIALEIRLREYTCNHYLEAGRTRSGKDGTFLFENLSPADYYCKVIADEYIAPADAITVSDDPAHIEIRLEPAARVMGRVTDENDRPIAGAVIIADRYFRAVTDAQGGYVLKGMPAKKNYLSIDAPGYALKDRDFMLVQCEKGQETIHNISMLRAGVIVLALKPETDVLAMPGSIGIRLQQTTGRSRRSESFRAPFDGQTAIFSNMPPGSYVMWVEDDAVGSGVTNVMITSDAETHAGLVARKTAMLSGAVADANGKPVDQAQLMLFALREKHTSDERDNDFKFARSDTNGAFKIKGLLPGRFEIRVSHDAYVHTNLIVTIGEDNLALNVVLDRGLCISGNIAESDGEPAAGVKIMAYAEERSDTTLTRRHSFGRSKTVELKNGVFVLTGLEPDGTYRLVFSSASDELDTLLTMDGVKAGTEELLISLGRRHTVHGVVSDVDGQPVAGAAFTVVRQEGGGTGRIRFSSYGKRKDANMTDAEGRFSVMLREGSQYIIEFVKPPLLPGKALVDLSAGTDAIASALSVVMQTGCTVSGVVVHADGRPAAGLIVESAVGEASMPFALGEDNDGTRRTDAEGRFVLPGVPSGVVTLKVMERQDEYRRKTMYSRDIMVHRDQSNETRIELPPMGHARAVVLNEAGDPVPDVYVSLMSPRNALVQASGQTDIEGAFVFTNMAAGGYMLMCFAQTEETGMRPQIRSVEIAAGRTLDLIIRPKEKADAAGASVVQGVIRGNERVSSGGKLTVARLPDEDSSDPMAMMSMFEDQIEAPVTTGGVFELGGLNAGAYYYSYHQSGKDGADADEDACISGVLQLTAEQTNIVIDLPVLALSGRVNSRDGKPLPRAQIMLNPAGVKIIRQHILARSARSDGEGKYKVEALAPGVYDVVVRHENFGAQRFEGVVIGADQEQRDFIMERGVVFGGLITDENGVALEGVSVMALAGGADADLMLGLARGWARTGADGAYAFDMPLTAGAYLLCAVHPGRVVAMTNVNVPSVTNFNVRLAPGGDIAVTVLRSGEPAPGMCSVITAADGHEVLRLNDRTGLFGVLPWQRAMVALTDETGKTRVYGLAEGVYTVGVQGATNTVAVSVRALDAATCVLRIGQDAFDQEQ